MSHLKPIDTKYNGYKFRSRLEARWAVFFDSYSVEYEYELEGYNLGHGICYLPDFYLPKLGVYVEIKPEENLTLSELKKLDALSLENDKNLLLIIGTPTKEKMFLINRHNAVSLSEYIYGNTFDKEEEKELIREYIGDLSSSCLVEFTLCPISHNVILAYINRSVFETTSFDEALIKAKQARFEFGESG